MLLSSVAFAIMILLIVIQVNWFSSTVDYQKKETHQKLKQLAPLIAMEVNGIDHNLFHGQNILVVDLPREKITNKIDSILMLHGFYGKVYFAIYQHQSNGVFLSNAYKYRKELLSSDIKSCISDIVSFSVVKDGTNKREGESEEEYQSRIYGESSFQYFSPVKGLRQSNDNDLWISLYQEQKLSDIMITLMWQFCLSIALLIILFGLLIYLLRSLAKHKKMSQIKTDFFNNLSHEFKVPIGSIRLASKVLRQSNNPEKNHSYHKIIEEESELLEKQVDKLLRISMFESEFSQIKNQELDLHEIIEGIPEKLKILIERNAAKIEFNLGSNQSLIYGDKEMLTSAFVNIVENSLKYSQEGVCVYITTNDDGEQRTIRIKDDGPGIDPRYEEQIFDRFFRANQGNQYKGKGFGIGLSYVKSIVEGHKGNIELVNHYPNGCEFVIEL
ncbi:sensor histidine kinase [Marinifilum breve]|uniref:sensor histidine kinase n=1 Tax=Marinifilum breve TaxID=2184082 RepID=UPI001402E634|nr:HAMP domain-containing sensor histidine kinase [Marinifilum breve]